ncbi:hypothetical protein [Xenorhabdus bovienii]|uniref:hypothetical protein n=1 Tax=Xenorhabdus bovienii TaxID=40576 RepID=UPI00237D318E|nr:hypothetical protein [Xenorhabdus bovienii]MDE1483655.1 hypothetical protein [Xenorhabdus bovienii]MDE9429811.1 hypothetical protein [Xenorhabdus bovienii]MDE9442885.1 hypothetical protein [Xenorhabdus bovienii]
MTRFVFVRNNKIVYVDEYYPPFGFFADYRRLIIYFSFLDKKEKDDFDYYLVTQNNTKILMAVRAYHGYGKKFYRVSPANE